MPKRYLGTHDLRRFPPALRRHAALLGLKHGTFLAQRWEADDDGVNLYHCADEGRGFFVEVGVEYDQEQPIVFRSFVGSVPLEDYSHWVRLLEL